VLARRCGQPAGLKTIAAAVGEAEDTIEEVFEPHLLRSGFLEKTTAGAGSRPRAVARSGVDPKTRPARRGTLF
jgi:Holliday junction DNA helicase RuvB